VRTVDAGWLAAGRYEVAVAGRLFDASVTLHAPYDPTSGRVRG
jgi:hypothetical protein